MEMTRHRQASGKMSQISRHVRMVVLLLLVVAGMLGSSAFSAEPPFPGIYRGTYHIDRWGEYRFTDVLKVSPELENELRPYLGMPILLNVTQISDDGGSPSTGVVGKIGGVKKLPTPVRLKIQWQHPKQPASGTINRLERGQGTKLKVTMTNNSLAPLSLDTARLHLRLYHPRPFEIDGKTSKNYFSVTPRWIAKILPKDQTFVAFTHSPTLHAEKLSSGEFVKHGKSKTWSLALTNVPPNEYEISIWYGHYQRTQGTYINIPSNVLRFDVLTDKPQCWQGLEVSLEPDADRKPSQPRSVAMRIRFKNTDEKPLRFGLWKAGDQWDVSQDVLLCYDARGTLLPLSKPTGKQTSETVRLEKGKDLTIPVDVPGDTKVARVAFHHRFDLTRFAKPDERVLEGDIYVFSRHLLLDSKEEKDKQK